MTARRAAQGKRVLLVILDGVGINPRKEANAVAAAKTPCYDALLRKYPWTTLTTHGEDVGLPEGVMGNSEVGHLNIGAGRVVDQPFTRVNKAIRSGEFFENETLRAHFAAARDAGKRLHLMGLLSTGGVHGDVSHVEALLELARRMELPADRVILHPFLDGRDMPPTSGAGLVERLARAAEGTARIATLSGRYYAMDRDKRWDRTEKAWRAIVLGEAAQPPGGAAQPPGEAAQPPGGAARPPGGAARPSGEKAVAAVRASYEKNVTDEFFLPTVVEPVGIEDGDAVFFWNFRPDRARQLTEALTEENFDGFARPRFPRIRYASMFRYRDDWDEHPVAFEETDLTNTLPEVLAAAGKRQFHTAETEKYAHVTYFLAGMKEEPVAGEVRALVPSPKVATYDLKPEMSAAGVTQKVEEALDAEYDFVVVNYANGDMVGHTGVFEAAVAAVAAADAGLSRIVPKALAKGYTAFVTADHGNAEQMVWYETGKPHTQHTTFPVHFIAVRPKGEPPAKLRPHGRLADIAPTVLAEMGIEPPQEMTGEDLVERRES